MKNIMIEENKLNLITPEPDMISNEMTNAGLHFGHRTSRIHPKMKPYLYGAKNGVHMINVEKTKAKLDEALTFIKKLTAEGKTILLVGTKIQFKDLVEEIGKSAGIYYITKRWLGGTFTNFSSVRKRVEYFKELEEKKEKGELAKYTKKERLKIDRELENLKGKFEGIKNMDKFPDAIFVLDMKKDSLAIKEARKKGITVIAIADTNVDPSLANYIIPANDDAISSVKFILEKVRDTIISSRS